MDNEIPVQDINEEGHEFHAMHRQLANSKKVLIIKSLHRRGTATASHLRAELSIKQPTASKYLGALVAAKLLSRTKVSTSVWYRIDKTTWEVFARWVSNITT